MAAVEDVEMGEMEYKERLDMDYEMVDTPTLTKEELKQVEKIQSKPKPATNLVERMRNAARAKVGATLHGLWVNHMIAVRPSQLFTPKRGRGEAAMTDMAPSSRRIVKVYKRKVA